MRVDVHTHLWSERTLPGFLRDYSAGRPDSSLKSGCDALLESMDDCGIDAAIAVALVHSADPTDQEVTEINQFVRDEVAKCPARLIGFCAVNPRSADAVAMLRDELAAGAKGLKFHGAMQQIDVDDRLMYPLYEVLAEQRRPVLFHSGDIGVLPIKDRHTRATLFDTVACDFPELPMILGHAGRIDWPTVAGLLRKHRNVYAEISSVIGRDPGFEYEPVRALLETVKSWAGSVAHILFGSDAPLYSQQATQSNLDRLLTRLPTLDTILTANDVLAVRNTNSSEFIKQHQLLHR